ncbi:MAG: phosphoribosyltransferase, partial [Betaproteobacteria bacterium]
QGELDIAQFITKTGGEMRGRLLLVDDLVDSGATLYKVIDHLRSRYPGITEVRTAVLWWKAVSKFKPDFFVQYLETSPWIHQPFEEYDTLRPNQLAPRLRSKVG